MEFGWGEDAGELVGTKNKSVFISPPGLPSFFFPFSSPKSLAVEGVFGCQGGGGLEHFLFLFVKNLKNRKLVCGQAALWCGEWKIGLWGDAGEGSEGGFYFPLALFLFLVLFSGEPSRFSGVKVEWVR